MVTLDSSALIALLNPRDPDNQSMATIVEPYLDELVIPVAVLSEISYFIERDLGNRRLILFVQDIVEGTLKLDCGERNWVRIQELVVRYADLPLALAEAAMIACAERNGGRVATLDFRHLGAVAREGTIQILS